MDSHQPTLVFVPGSWHRPSCYDKIVKILQDEHHIKCKAISLPSTEGNPEATFKDDLYAARAVITSEVSKGRHVVLVAHSYGGMVANSAIRGFARPATKPKDSPPSTREATAGYVIGLILIASGYTLGGMTFMDPFFNIPPPAWRFNTSTGFADLVTDTRQFFYHDLPVDEGNYWVSQLTTQTLKSLIEGRDVSYSGWLDVPSWYIGTTEDQGLPVAVQRLGVGAARAMGARVQHRELRTSHSPFLSQPEEVVRIMVQAVESFTTGDGDGQLAVQRSGAGGNDRVMLPAFKLLQPYTWLKYGLPLALGRLVGNGYLAYTWVSTLWRRS